MTNESPEDNKVAVRTESKARDILRAIPEVQRITRNWGFCECGKCSALLTYDKQDKVLGYVLICPLCGDDELMSQYAFHDA